VVVVSADGVAECRSSLPSPVRSVGAGRCEAQLLRSVLGQAEGRGVGLMAAIEGGDAQLVAGGRVRRGPEGEGSLGKRRWCRGKS
jgi:hypothetical protein